MCIRDSYASGRIYERRGISGDRVYVPARDAFKALHGSGSPDLRQRWGGSEGGAPRDSDLKRGWNVHQGFK